MIRRTPGAALIAGLLLVGCHGRSESAGPGYSAAGLYNSANSYARAGKPGLAVLYYERARLLAPDDPDIEANLRYVREAAHLPSRSWNRFARAVIVGNPTALAWIGLSGFSIAGMSVLAGRRYSRYRGTRRAASIAGLALVSLTAANGVLLWPMLHEAVVMTGSTPVRVSPVPMGEPLAVLPEAAIVKTTVEYEGFVLIQTTAGVTGWVSRASLAPIVPRP